MMQMEKSSLRGMTRVTVKTKEGEQGDLISGQTPRDFIPETELVSTLVLQNLG